MLPASIQTLHLLHRQTVKTEQHVIGRFLVQVFSNRVRRSAYEIRLIIERRQHRQRLRAAKFSGDAPGFDYGRLKTRLSVLRIERRHDYL